MSSLVLAGNVSGTVTFQAPDVAGTTVLTLPTTSGTIFTANTSGGPLNAASGGTGLTSPGTSGNYLVSNGTTWVSQAPPAAGVTSFNTRTGAVTLASADVTTALGYTPPQPNGTGASGTWAINVTGNAATANAIANTGGWAVTPSGTKLYFAYNGTNVGSLDSSGNFIALGNVTAYGTP